MHSPFNSQILSEQCIVSLILNFRYYLNKHSLFNSQILSEQCIVPLILNLRYYLNNAQSLKFSDIILTMQSPFNSQILSEHCTETFFTALFLGQNYKPILYCSVSDITRRINTLHRNFLYSFIFGSIL